MAEFDDLRQQLQQTRAQRDDLADRLQRSKEQLKRLAADKASLDRIFDPRNEEHRRRQARIESERADAEGDLKRGQAGLRQVAAQLDEAVKGFAVLSDPREAIGRLSDQFPILLFPVRLETRFKNVTLDGVGRRQLWVRIYP